MGLIRFCGMVPALLLAYGSALAQAPATNSGAAGFCLYALPAEGGSQRHINLAIVQYVELKNDGLLIAYGGGNLGSGHEARLPAKSRDEALALLQTLTQTAAACAAGRH